MISLNDVTSIYITLLYELGHYGPIILILISWYLLWNNKYLFFYYTIGIFLNAVLNITLKGIIKEPRPLFDKNKVGALTSHAKKFIFQNGVPFVIYGMPSGHVQSAAFSTIFIYLSLKNKNILLFYLMFTFLVGIQRVKFNYHTINQVLVGSIVGSTFAYLLYHFTQDMIKGKIREKPDDNGPI